MPWFLVLGALYFSVLVHGSELSLFPLFLGSWFLAFGFSLSCSGFVVAVVVAAVVVVLKS